MRTIVVVFILTNSTLVLASDYCKYIPYQRAEADVPVHAGKAELPVPHSGNIIVHIVNYNKSLAHALPIDPTNPRLHSHIWVVDTINCKKLLELPLPHNASINVHAIKTDTKALPINRLPNGSLEFKYAFAIPSKPNVAIIRKVIVDKKWKITSKKDVKINVRGDVSRAILLADWHPNGKVLALTKSTKNKKAYTHYILHFDNNKVLLFRFQLGHPEAHLVKEGILFDEIRTIKVGKKLHKFALLTVFDTSMKHYRQYKIDVPGHDGPFPQYVYPIQHNKITIFQLENIIFDSKGVVLFSSATKKFDYRRAVKQAIKNYNKVRKGVLLLPNYLNDDRLKTKRIMVYLWKEGKWVEAPQLRPKPWFSSKANF